MTRAAAWTLAVIFLIAFTRAKFKINFAGAAIDHIHPALVCAFIIDVALALFLIAGRTDAALQSPWMQISLRTGLLYCVSTALLFFGLRKNSGTWLWWIPLFAHFFITYGVALLVFRYGYGYDPLIHAAAEKFSAVHGNITPLQPFYNGLYGPVVWLHQITRIPIDLLNQWLVPVLAIITIPPVLYNALIHGANIPAARARVLLLLTSIIPFKEFTFSVPHNVTAVYVVWWTCVVALPITRARIVLLALIAVAACVTHPLLGAPIFIMTIILFLLRAERAQKILWSVGWILIAAAPLLLFSAFRLISGLPFFSPQPPGVHNLISIFGFVHHVQHARILLQLAFGYSFLLPYAGIIAGLCGLSFFHKNYRVMSASMISAIIISICIFASIIVLPGIIFYEQNEFALRMRYALPLFLLPPLLAWIDSRLRRIKNLFMWCGVCVLLTGALTLSWYFTYPGNTNLTRPGFNVSAADISVVQLIAERAVQTPHIVIAPQITAGAARNILGFDYTVTLKNGARTFPYAEGPDNELRTATDKILYYYFSRADFEKKFAHEIDALYVVVPQYWYRKEKLIEELLQTQPREVIPLDGATIFVLE